MATDVKVVVKGDASQAKKEIGGFSAFGVAKGQLLADGIKSAFKGIASAFTGIANSFKEFVSLSNIQEEAVNKLNQAMKSAGDFSAAASEEMQTFATGLQNIAGVGDEAILEMLALAKSFGTTNEQARQMTSAAADFAVAADINMTEALRRLGRATRGSVDDVAKFVPAIKDLTKEQLAAGEATRLIAERFAGVAAAATETFSGRMDKLGLRVGDAKEKLGDMAKEGLAPLVPILTNLITKGEEFIAKYGEEIGEKLKAVGETVAELAVRFGDFLAAHNDEMVMAVANAMKLLVEATSAAVKVGVWLVETYADAREIFAVLLETLEPFIRLSAKLNKAIGSDTLGQALEDMADGLAANTKAQIEFSAKTRQMGKAAIETADALELKFKAGIDKTANSLKGMAEGQELVGLKGAELVAGLRAQGDVVQQVGSDWVKTGELVDDAGNKLTDTWAKVGEEVDEFGRAVVNVASTVPEAAGKMIDSFKELTPEKFKQGALDLVTTFETLKERFGSSERAAGLLRTQFDALRTKAAELGVELPMEFQKIAESINPPKEAAVALTDTMKRVSDGLRLSSDSSVYFAKTLTEAGAAGGAMGQAVAAGVNTAKQAIQEVANVTRQMMMETSHAAATARSDAAGGGIGGVVGTGNITGSGERADFDPKRLKQILSRLKGAEGATPGFFRNITQAFTQELAGGADVGKLEQIFERLQANQRAVQTAQNRADLTGDTAGDLRGIEQIMAQVLGEIRRMGTPVIDMNNIAGGVEEARRRGQERRR
jgi:hypothetical protein